MNVKFPSYLIAAPEDWSWLGITIDDGTTHIVPLLDVRVHAIHGPCWCSPVDTGSEIAHNSADGRERYERGQARMH